MDYQAEYRSKLRTPGRGGARREGRRLGGLYVGARLPAAARCGACRPGVTSCTHVKVRGNLCMGPLQIVECDPEQTHFLYHTWHCSAYERRLCDRGLCYFTPMIFRNLAWYYRRFSR